MALAPSFFTTFMLLLPLLFIASAADYGYVPTPHVEQPKPVEEPTYKPDDKIPRPAGEPTYKPDDKIPKPESEKNELPLLATIGVQGLVLCNSGSRYFPLQGAVARVTCLGVDEYGHDFPPFSALSHPTDSKGYFLATLSPSELQAKLKITECKVFLESSPLESCKVPTDVNYGLSGAQLSTYRLLNDNNIKLYSMGPFIYTSQSPQTPAPNGY